MVVPVNAVNPMRAEYRAAFHAIPRVLLEEFLACFPCPDTKIQHIPIKETQILEYIFCRQCLADLPTPGINLRAWVQAITHYSGDYDDVYVKRHVHRYLSAASKIKRRRGTSPVEMDKVYVHPQLQIHLSAPVTIGCEAYVSLVETDDPRYMILYHMIWRLFDIRTPVFIHDLVFDLVFSQTDMTLEAYGSKNDQGEMLWRIASALAKGANIRIRPMCIAFDLEWNNHNPKTRFREGDIVDAHFEDVDTGWVIFSGLLRVPFITKLSPFLVNHDYSLRDLVNNGRSLDMVRQRIADVEAISESVIFTAFNGINADNYVLRSNNVFLSEYIDAHVYLTAGRLVSLAELYKSEFGEPFIAHNAATDTAALLRIIRARGITASALRTVYEQLVLLGAK